VDHSQPQVHATAQAQPHVQVPVPQQHVAAYRENGARGDVGSTGLMHSGAGLAAAAPLHQAHPMHQLPPELQHQLLLHMFAQHQAGMQHHAGIQQQAQMQQAQMQLVQQQQQLLLQQSAQMAQLAAAPTIHEHQHAHQLQLHLQQQQQQLQQHERDQQQVEHTDTEQVQQVLARIQNSSATRQPPEVLPALHGKPAHSVSLPPPAQLCQPASPMAAQSGAVGPVRVTNMEPLVRRTSGTSTQPLTVVPAAGASCSPASAVEVGVHAVTPAAHMQLLTPLLSQRVYVDAAAASRGGGVMPVQVGPVVDGHHATAAILHSSPECPKVESAANGSTTKDAIGGVWDGRVAVQAPSSNHLAPVAGGMLQRWQESLVAHLGPPQ
jgi:hypothetical protein